MTEIRSATSADAGALAELRWEFRTGRLPPAETHDVFVKRCAPWMRRELANGELVARLGGRRSTGRSSARCG